MYNNILTSIWISHGDTNDFSTRIGLHQGLSSYLLNLVMDVVMADIQEGIPRCMLFTNDVMLPNESQAWVNRKVKLRRGTLKSKCCKLCIAKIEYTIYYYT
jgi:hypothetical protein